MGYGLTVEEEMLAAVAALPVGLRVRAETYPFPQLHNACLDADQELIEGLLNAGLSADMYTGTEDEDDVPPLVWIAAYRDGDIGAAAKTIALLIGRGADIDNDCPLLVAAERGDLDLVRVFHSAGADVDLALSEDPTDDARALIFQAINLGAIDPTAS